MQLLRTWTFKWWEIGVLKLCLISLGILLCLYFSEYLARLLYLWWTLFVVTTLYFLLRFFREA